MSNVDWRGVPAPESEPEPEPKSPIPGMIGFFVAVVALLLGGGALVNMTMFGNRIKERSIDSCDGPSCVLEVRSVHDDCYSDHITWSVPKSAAAFQTPRDSDMLGALSIDYASYRTCLGVDKPATLEERDAANR